MQTAPTQWVRRFVVFWVSQTVARFGGAFSNFALVWWVTKTFGSATALATGTLLSMLPGIIFGPFIGAIVDRHNRKVFIVASNLIFATSALILYLLSHYGLLQLWHLYITMFVNSLAGQFHFMAISAVTPLMVPEAELQRVSGFNQLREGAVSIVAPPFGALLLEFIHLDGILLLEMCLGVAAALMMLTVVVPALVAPPLESRLSMWQDTKAGISYVASWPGLMAILAVAMLLNLFLTPAFTLLPLLVKDHFNGGAIQLAWFEMAVGIGMIVGSVLLGVWGGFKRRMTTMACGLVGMSLAVSVLAWVSGSGLWWAIGAMALIGLTQPLTNGPLFAILQSTVPVELQGRIMGLMGSMSGLVAPLGLALAGPASDYFGLQIWFRVAVVIMWGLVPLILFWPTLRNLEDQHTGARA